MKVFMYSVQEVLLLYLVARHKKYLIRIIREYMVSELMCLGTRTVETPVAPMGYVVYA